MDWGDIILLLTSFITYRTYVPFRVSQSDSMSSADSRAARRNAHNRGAHQQLSGLVTFVAAVLLGASGVVGSSVWVWRQAVAQVMPSQRQLGGLQACGARAPQQHPMACAQQFDQSYPLLS